MDFTCRPLVTWPGKPTARRKRSPFRAGYVDTLRLLDAELRHLGARNISLQVALAEDQIRLDGRPRADAVPRHPGIVLAFDSKHGPLSYPCDTYDSWEDNLRAIALALEALRAVDRYGVTRSAEQYRGWTALPPPKAGDAATAQQAAGVLCKAAGMERVSKDTLDEVYRAAVKRTHPDAGGSSEVFQRVQEAREVLRRHWGLT